MNKPTDFHIRVKKPNPASGSINYSIELYRTEAERKKRQIGTLRLPAPILPERILTGKGKTSLTVDVLTAEEIAYTNFYLSENKHIQTINLIPVIAHFNEVLVEADDSVFGEMKEKFKQIEEILESLAA